jgi:hypothetical protein
MSQRWEVTFTYEQGASDPLPVVFEGLLKQARYNVSNLSYQAVPTPIPPKEEVPTGTSNSTKNSSGMKSPYDFKMDPDELLITMTRWAQKGLAALSEILKSVE